MVAVALLSVLVPTATVSASSPPHPCKDMDARDPRKSAASQRGYFQLTQAQPQLWSKNNARLDLQYLYNIRKQYIVSYEAR